MELRTNKDEEHGHETFSQKFSIGSLLYTRLRRSTSRVIDVMYLSENSQYAEYVIDLARATNDQELHRLATNLEHIFAKDTVSKEGGLHAIRAKVEYGSGEPTKEDIIREQVAHRYIGSLR